MKILLIQRVVPHYRVDLFDEINTLLKVQHCQFYILCGESIGATKYRNADNLPVYVKTLLKGNKWYEEKIKIYFNLFTCLLRQKPNIIVSEGGANTINNLQLFIYSKIFNIPYVIWDLGKFVKIRERKNIVIETIYWFIYKIIIKSSKAIIVYNNTGSDYFKRTFNIPAERIQILHNTINESGIFNSQKNALIDQEFEKFSVRYQNVILFVGAIDYDKNLDFLVEIQKKLSKDYAFLIIGDGIYRDKLVKLLDLQNTYFTGRVTDLNKLAYYYSKSKVFVLPGLGGLSINQSLAYGVPVVCSKADGSEFDLIIENKTGCIVEMNNVNKWVDSIRFFCAGDKTKFAKYCTDHIKNNFTLKGAALNFVKVINYVTNEKILKS